MSQGCQKIVTYYLTVYQRKDESRRVALRKNKANAFQQL